MANQVLRVVRERVQRAADDYATLLETDRGRAHQRRGNVALLVDDFNSDLIEAAGLPLPSGVEFVEPIAPVPYPRVLA